MHTLIKPRFILVFAALFALVSAGACTLEDGEPFGYARFDLSADEPNLGPEFTLKSFEIEVESVHLRADPAAQEDDDDHGHDHDHDHDHGHSHDDEPAAPSAEDLEVAHIEADAHITSTDPVSLAEVAITNDATATIVELEVHALHVQGHLTRDDESSPTQIDLEHAHLRVSGPADVHFGPDTPETQRLSVALRWPDNWLEDVDTDQLKADEDGKIHINGSSNSAATAQIAEHLHGANLTMEVH